MRRTVCRRLLDRRGFPVSIHHTPSRVKVALPPAALPAVPPAPLRRTDGPWREFYGVVGRPGEPPVAPAEDATAMQQPPPAPPQPPPSPFRRYDNGAGLTHVRAHWCADCERHVTGVLEKHLISKDHRSALFRKDIVAQGVAQLKAPPGKPSVNPLQVWCPVCGEPVSTLFWHAHEAGDRHVRTAKLAATARNSDVSGLPPPIVAALRRANLVGADGRLRAVNDAPPTSRPRLKVD